MLDLLLIGGLIYLVYRLFVRRRGGQSAYYEDAGSYPGYGMVNYGYGRETPPQMNEVERGLEDIRGSDPSFNTENFLETVEDLFFRIQAAWMNRSFDGARDLVTSEMKDYHYYVK